MDITAGFSVLERCGNTLQRLSDCRWWWSLREVKFFRKDFFTCRIWNVFACRSITMSLSKKWRQPLDSACLKSVEIPFQGFLTVDVDGLYGGWKLSGGILKIGKLNMFLRTEPLPTVLWPNRWYYWIQRVE